MASRGVAETDILVSSSARDNDVKNGKTFRIFLIAVPLAAALLAGGGIFFLNRYLNSSGFREFVRNEAREKAGVDLALEGLSVDLFRGAVARNVALAASEPGQPPVLEAGEIEFSCRWGDLLKKKVAIDEVRVVRPKLRLGGTHPLGGLLSPPSGESGRKGGKRGKKVAGEKAGEGWIASVSSLRVSEGSVEIATGTAFDPVEAEGIDAALSFPAPGKAEAALTVASAGWGRREVLKNGRAEATFSGLDPDSFAGEAAVKGSGLIADPFAPEREAEKAEFSLRASAREGSARIEDFRAILAGAEVSGRLSASLQGRELRAEGEAAFAGSDVGEVLRRIFLVEKPPVRGEVRGDFAVSGPVMAGAVPLPDFRGKVESSALAFPAFGVAREIVVPLRSKAGKVSAEEATAQIAGGSLIMSAEADLSALGPSPFRASFQADAIDLDRLFRESPYSHRPAWRRFRCAGSLSAWGKLSGDSTGLATIEGKGKGVITGGAVSGYPIPSALAEVIGGAAEAFEFEKAEGDFSCREGTVTIKEATVHTSGMKIVARGTVGLTGRSELDLRVALLYPPELAEEQPKALRLALRPMPGEKGMLGIEFRVFGPSDRPETDLPEVMARRAIGGFLGGH